jgi:hypothetical protein
MAPIDCPETSVRNYHYLLRKNLEERSYETVTWHKISKLTILIMKFVLDRI